MASKAAIEKGDDVPPSGRNRMLCRTSLEAQWVRGATSRSFLSDVRAEMRKVVAPTRKEVQATTSVVIVTVFIFGVFLLW